MSENGCRPDVACICVDDGIHVGISVTGEHRELFLDQFRQEHSGPGHIPEIPARSWFGKEAAFKRHLERIRAALAEPTLTENVEDWRPVEDVRTSEGKL